MSLLSRTIRHVYNSVKILSLVGSIALLGQLRVVPAVAALDSPVRDVNQLEKPSEHAFEERVQFARDARVVAADYELLRQDFPSLKAMTSAQIDHWLIKNAAVVAIPQTMQEIVNTKIAVALQAGKPRETVAYRPFSYRRALVVEPLPHHLIDVKGTGSLAPAQKDLGNGLATVSEVLREFIFEKKVAQIFSHAGASYRTVGSYAVIDLGFEVIDRDGRKSPAGSILRQGHTRYSREYITRFGNAFVDEALSRNIELLLRRYGMTSADQFSVRSWRLGSTRDVVNVQGNPAGEIVDFGTYRVADRFSRPAFWYPLRERDDVRPLIDPNGGDLSAPIDELRISPKNWVRESRGEDGDRRDLIGLEADRLAQSFRNSGGDREPINRYVKARLAEGAFLYSSTAVATRIRLAQPLRCSDLF